MSIQSSELGPLRFRPSRRSFLKGLPAVVLGSAGLAAGAGAGAAVLNSGAAAGPIEGALNALAAIGQESEHGRYKFYGQPVVYNEEKKALVLALKGSVTGITFDRSSNIRFRHKAQVGGQNNPDFEYTPTEQVKAQYGYMVAGGGNHDGEEGAFPLLDQQGNVIGRASKWYVLTDINGLSFVAPDNNPLQSPGEKPYFISNVAVADTNEHIDLHRSLHRYLFTDRTIGSIDNPITFEEFARKNGFDVEIRFPKYDPVKVELGGVKNELQTRSYPFLDNLQKDIRDKTFDLSGQFLSRTDEKGNILTYTYSHEVALLDRRSNPPKVAQVWAARQEGNSWVFNAVKLDSTKYLNAVNELPQR